VTAFFLTNFKPRTLLTWPVFTVSLVWAVATNFSDIDNNPPGNVVMRIVAVSSAHVIFFLAVAVFVFATRFLPELIGALAMIPAMVLLSVFRGWVAFTFLFAIGHDSVDLLEYRMVGSIANVGVSTLITAVVVHRVRTYRETRRALLTEQFRLVEVRDHAGGRLDDMSRRTLEEVRSSIMGALDVGEVKPTLVTTDRIERTIEEVIRPLSHRLEREQVTWVPDETGVRPESVRWQKVLQNALSRRHLYPFAVGLALGGVATATSFRNHPTSEALYVVAMAVVGTPFGLIVTRWMMDRVSGAWGKRLVMVFGALTTGLLTGLGTLPVKLDTDNPLSLVIQSPLFTLAFTVLFALAGSATWQAEKTTKRLAQTTNELAWEVARVSEHYRQARAKLARALHGKIQAGMMSSLIRLKQAIKNGEQDLEALTAQIEKDLTALVDSLGHMSATQTVSLDEILENVRETWEGVAACQLTIQEETERLLGADPIALATLTDLIPELAFNAIKHGQATLVSFELESADNHLLTMTCRDNGLRPPELGRVGLGTKLLDECAVSWQRSSADGGTVTEIVLPLSPEKAMI
jgi:two-component sensor histidine kinase